MNAAVPQGNSDGALISRGITSIGNQMPPRDKNPMMRWLSQTLMTHCMTKMATMAKA